MSVIIDVLFLIASVIAVVAILDNRQLQSRLGGLTCDQGHLWETWSDPEKGPYESEQERCCSRCNMRERRSV